MLGSCLPNTKENLSFLTPFYPWGLALNNSLLNTKEKIKEENLTFFLFLFLIEKEKQLRTGTTNPPVYPRCSLNPSLFKLYVDQPFQPLPSNPFIGPKGRCTWLPACEGMGSLAGNSWHSRHLVMLASVKGLVPKRYCCLACFRPLGS